jgi:hypothetical protein
MKKIEKATPVTTTKEPINKTSTPAGVKPDAVKKEVVKPAPKVTTLAQLAGVYAKRKLAFDRLRGGLVTRLESLRKGIERMQNAMAQVEAKLASIVAPNSNQALIEPLAKELIALFPGYTYQVTGPVGMLDAITISLIPAGASDEDKVSGKGCKILTILTKTKDGKLCVRDYSKNSGAFLPGSAGFDSGLQYGTIPVPDDASIEFFSKLVK